MKVIVVGLGSMGKRRIRLLRAFFSDTEIAGIDSREDRRKEAFDLFSIPCYPSVEDAVAAFSPDAGFVSTSPLSHGDLIHTLLLSGLHVFTEINLTDYRYEENTALANEQGKTLFLSSTPMYRKEIEYISGAVKGKEKLRYRYHVGQYLPDWHPWENYKDFFVGDARTNGCRELFAIELPWIVDAFGRVVAFSSESEKLTDLAIDYPDCYAVTFTHESGVVGQMMVDVVSRKAVRDLEIFGEDLYLRWGGTPSSLNHYDIGAKADRNIECYSDAIQDTRYSDNIVENAYVAEISDFFSAIGNKVTPRHSFSADKEILELIDSIEGVSE